MDPTPFIHRTNVGCRISFSVEPFSSLVWIAPSSLCSIHTCECERGPKSTLRRWLSVKKGYRSWGLRVHPETRWRLVWTVIFASLLYAIALPPPLSSPSHGGCPPSPLRSLLSSRCCVSAPLLVKQDSCKSLWNMLGSPLDCMGNRGRHRCVFATEAANMPGALLSGFV